MTAFVHPDEFRNAMKSLTGPLAAYAIAMAGPREANPRLPAADSSAMRELAAETDWATDDWSQPAFNAHSYGHMLVYALAEHLAAYAAVVEVGNVGPAYAHAPSARAIMEIAPTAAWLMEPGIGVEARIKRSIAYRLTSSNQAGRLQHIDSAREHATASRQATVDYATIQGWVVAEQSGRVSIGSEAVPNPATSFTNYAIGTRAVDLDRALWNVLSALQHGTWYALSDGLGERMRTDPFDDRIGAAPIVVSGQHLTVVGLMCWFGCRAAYETQRELMGWEQPNDIREAEQALMSQASSIAQQARDGSLDVTP